MRLQERRVRIQDTRLSVLFSLSLLPFPSSSDAHPFFSLRSFQMSAVQETAGQLCPCRPRPSWRGDTHPRSFPPLSLSCLLCLHWSRADQVFSRLLTVQGRLFCDVAREGTGAGEVHGGLSSTLQTQRNSDSTRPSSASSLIPSPRTQRRTRSDGREGSRSPSKRAVHGSRWPPFGVGSPSIRKSPAEEGREGGGRDDTVQRAGEEASAHRVH